MRHPTLSVRDSLTHSLSPPLLPPLSLPPSISPPSISPLNLPLLSPPFSFPLSKASVATQAAATAEGRAAAAEIELLRTRAKLLSAEEKYARVEREAASDYV